MKTKIAILIFTVMCLSSFAQQDSQFTQYMYNTININPAYAGSRGVMSVFGMHRTQWVGLDGAPTTNAFSINTPLNNSNLGLGISFIGDKIGPTNDNTMSVDLSYSIQASDEYKLSFGLKTSLNIFSLDVNKLNPTDANDPSLQNLTSELSPNVGAGVYLHSDKLYVGFSVPNFLEDIKYSDNSISVFKERMNFYFIGGYVFDVSPILKFKPAVLSKIVTGAPLQVDASANFMLYDKFVLGGAYRWDAAASVMAGFQVSDSLFIGYGHDRETTNLRRYNSGSHEIFIRYEFYKRISKITTPRFF